MKPRLLFVSPRFLFPMDQGGKIRTANILRNMKGGLFEITLVSPAPADHARFQAEIDGVCDRFLHWPEKPASQVKRVLSLLGRYPVAVASDISAPGRSVVRAALAARPDVAVVDFPHTDVLMPRRVGCPPAGCPTVMFTHNVEAEIFERHAIQAKGLMRRVWQTESRKMDWFEGEALRRHDVAIAVSDRDRTALAKRYGLQRVEVIDTGVDLDFFAPQPVAAPPALDGGTLIFTATMSWPANVDAIHFLLDEVFPILVKARPRIAATIVGRNPPPTLAEKVRTRGLNVTLTGFVDDIRPYVAAADVYVIPLQVGSGTRIKAFEAMAMGRPVVSTTIGVEGLEVTDGTHYLRADDAVSFAAGVLRLLDDAELRVRLAGNARGLIEEKFSWKHVASQFEAICSRAMASTK
ncbi:MAG TPA: glycosyltransferase [Rhodopila sp.]|nr:glycosyltransferase [Rhodopila sp.]